MSLVPTTSGYAPWPPAPLGTSPSDVHHSTPAFPRKLPRSDGRVAAYLQVCFSRMSARPVFMDQLMPAGALAPLAFLCLSSTWLHTAPILPVSRIGSNVVNLPLNVFMTPLSNTFSRAGATAPWKSASLAHRRTSACPSGSDLHLEGA